MTACGVPLGEGAGLGATDAYGPGCQLTAQKASIDPVQCVDKGQVPIYSNRFSAGCGISSVVSGADAFAGTTPSADSTTPSLPDAAPSAMTVSCGEPDCSAGQVAVTDAQGSATHCVEAPPSCPEGQSPQYVFSSSTWECTDCSVVITYGSSYGNYTRCASAPTISCPEGQVPTWVYEDEQWECQDTCDNGAYDQHTVSGSTVCVPC